VLKANVCVLWERCLQQTRHAHDQPGEVDCLEDQAAAARISQHLLRQVCSPQGCLSDLVEVSPGRDTGGQSELGDLGIAQHAGQQVVKVVGNTAGQDAETLQFLRLLEPS